MRQFLGASTWFATCVVFSLVPVPVANATDSPATPSTTAPSAAPAISTLRPAGVATANPTAPTTATSATSATSAASPLAHRKEVLANGLTVILHEDHTVPVVVVNISYNVGSRDEVVGRTGFAHLFEHLMFMGTRRAPTKKFDAWMEAAGGWNNAWTSEDRTDYFDVGPSTALPLLLWLEADRLRDIGPLMTLDKLNAQRDVVKNERRQSYENKPYGKADLRLSELLFPATHPYHHPVIGTHADLEAASVTDVKAFFAEHYDPANASLVVAGDFVQRDTLGQVRRLFEGISSAGLKKKSALALPARTESVVETMMDDVELPRVTLAWVSAAHFAADDAELDLLGSILGDGKSGRLYRSIVFDKKLGQSVSAHQSSGTLQSHFDIELTGKAGGSLAPLEALVNQELAKIAKDGPTEAELNRVRAGYEAAFVKRLESVRERASLLNLYQAERGRPDALDEDLRRYRNATAASIAGAARKLFAGPRVTLRVMPEKVPATKDGGHASATGRGEGKSL